ncbi:MAG: AMP-binding protein [Gammaproteobacteria bacterium]
MNSERQDRLFALYRGRCLSDSEFMCHVLQAREILRPIAQANDRIMNLCEDRYHFLVLFAASMLECMITVMPSNQSQGELYRLRKAHPGMQTVNDDTVMALCQGNADAGQPAANLDLIDKLPRDSVVAELYTSGSTGMPTANAKSWGELVHGAQRVAERFGLNSSRQHVVIATVPPQHMFGFEMSVVLPLVAGVAVFHGKPFYPDDIDQALQSVPEPRMLVTTPVHLKACMKDHRDWPTIDFILSSTAALSAEVARQAGNVLRAPIREIYGCSEVGAIATRTTNETECWQLLGDFRLVVENKNIYLSSSILAEPLLISDQIGLQQDGTFRLLGRAADLVKIGGKRGSLADITIRIKSIVGVEDAVVFLPATQSGKRERLVALVVARDLTPGEIRRRLSEDIDAVFVPRQIYLVARLPYNPTGKLPRSELLAMLAANQKSEQAC